MERLRFVSRGRELGFSLEEIRQWLQIYDKKGSREQYQVWIDMADRQLAVLDGQIADLTAARADLDQLRQTTVAELAKMG